MNKHDISIECNAKVKACLDRLLSEEEKEREGKSVGCAPRFLVIGDTPSDSLMADVMVYYWSRHTHHPEVKPVAPCWDTQQIWA